MNLPNSELVAMAWISSIPGIQVDGVGAQLPADETTWGTYGYITVNTVGGAPLPEMGVRKPVIQVDCWATVPGSDKLPWARASALAEQVVKATHDRVNNTRGLTLSQNGVAYPSARCTAYALTEPRRAYSDIGDYAGYSFDLQLNWLTAESDN